MTESEYLQDGEDYFLADNPEIFYPDKSKLSKTIDGIQVYRCTRCGQYKPKNEYYKDKRVPCGIRNKCKKCYHK